MPVNQLISERPLLAAGSIDHCNTEFSLSAGLSKPKVFLGRWFILKSLPRHVAAVFDLLADPSVYHMMVVVRPRDD